MVKVRKQTAKTKQTTKKPGVLSRIKTISFDSDGVKLNVYGRSGTGKTTFWATFPKPILALVCSGGQKPGELRSIDTPAYRKTIKQLVVQSSSELHDVVEHQQNRSEYATLVLDHATGLQDLILTEILELDEIPLGWYAKPEKNQSWGLASQADYGQLAVQIKKLFRGLLTLDCNVVVVAQEREHNVDTDSELILPYVASALTPSIVGWLNPACDYICQTFIRPKTETKNNKVGKRTVSITKRTKGVEYCLRTGPHDVFTTKFRLPKRTPLPEVIVDPTFDKLEQLIKGAK
jgi:hypothetical protein